MKFCKQIIFLFIGIVVYAQSDAQFTDGNRLSFSLSNYQNANYKWVKKDFPKYDIYYAQGNDTTVKQIEQNIVSNISLLQNILGFRNKQKLHFVVYNSKADCDQTNIGFTGFEQEMALGVFSNTETNKILLYTDKNISQLQTLLLQKMAYAFIETYITDGGISRQFSTNIQTVQIPTWFSIGLASFIANQYDSLLVQSIKRTINYNSSAKNTISEADEIAVGQAFCGYLYNTYGAQVISDIMYVTSTLRDFENAFLYATNRSLKDLYSDFRQKLSTAAQNKYFESDLKKLLIHNTLYQGITDSIHQEQTTNLPIEYHPQLHFTRFDNQLQYGFTGSSYQPYSGISENLNSGFNIFIKASVFDFFEDYRISIGARFSGMLSTNDYFLSLENIKRRLDKQIVFHRTSQFSLTETDTNKHQTNEIQFNLAYPLTKTQTIRTMFLLRNDRRIALTTHSIDNHLNPKAFKPWAGVHFEYVFNKTQLIGTNLPTGFKAKAFCEFYNGIDQTDKHIFIFGTDLRKYFKIGKSIIWANRLSYSSSAGNVGLLYYLGSVNNQLNNHTNNTLATDNSKEWIFQALATNMRGFNKNARNGNSFALFNTEVRIPLLQTLFHLKTNSDFLNNFQIVAFSDIGSAWDGWKFNTSQQQYLYSQPYGSINKYAFISRENPLLVGYGTGIRTTIIGYMLKADWAWNTSKTDNAIFYLSLGLDF